MNRLHQYWRMWIMKSSNLEPTKKEGKTSERVTARSATKDKILLPSSPTTSQQWNPTPLVALKA
ncbi:hypothetical protein RchiOBHm_Chr4g0397891 [Rosa chinensis]|uniref:Uncharacterized protein n=1 Tax=Rosa chinensis TaxID=74649 RepID=A0A2P6QS60_ROSCH|nr:hypothetical protein RchiOBHm_Chr4g0397891 [Rosa chinensis]